MLRQPPSASPLSRSFARIAEAAIRLPRSRAWLILACAMVLTTITDVATGPEVNFGIFYLTLACFASWCIGERTGLGVGVIGVAMLGFSHSAMLNPHDHTTVGTLAWNMAARGMTLVAMIAAASGLRHALDQASWSATTDALTGVLNKGAFQRRLGPMISHMQRRGEALVLAYIDLDGFKGLNDGFGHAAGDALLRTFAEQANDAIRAHDLFARLGGDEFVALLTVPNCHLGDTAAERLHDRMSRILRGTGHAVTCSMGAMVVNAGDITNPDDLVAAADGLMYEVKRSGKNALRIARLDLQPAMLPPSPPMPDRRQRRSNTMAIAA